MRLRLALLFLPLALLACVPPPAPPPPPVAPPDTGAALRRELAALPGAVVGEAEPLTVSYPGETLFAAGSVLPLPGGTAVLDPLAAVLAAHPELNWRGTVRARTEVSPEYDAALAGKRLELLQRYFRNKGIDGERLPLTALVAPGAPLELTLAPADQPAVPASIPASSSREKR